MPDLAGVTCTYLDGTKPTFFPSLFIAPSLLSIVMFLITSYIMKYVVSLCSLNVTTCIGLFMNEFSVYQVTHALHVYLLLDFKSRTASLLYSNQAVNWLFLCTQRPSEVPLKTNEKVGETFHTFIV